MREFVSIDGVRLEYAWHGPSSNETPTLVFLHEGLGSISQWRDFPAALGERTGCGALVYSRRGHGGSDPLTAPLPVRFMHDEALSVLPSLLAHFHIECPILIGHSTGASIALIYAASDSAAPLALALEAPHVFVEDSTVMRIAEVRSLYPTTDLRTKLARHHGPNVDMMFRGWTDIWLRPEFRGWTIERDLPRVTCPLLVLQGREDEYGTERQVDAIVRGVSGPVDAILLDDCGHSPHIDQRVAVETAMARFVGALSGIGNHGSPPA